MNRAEPFPFIPTYWTHHQLAQLNHKQRDQTDPHHPRMPYASELTDDSTFTDIKLHLWFLGATLECHPQSEAAESMDQPFLPDGKLSNWILKDSPITFTDCEEKRKWKQTGTLRQHRVFDYFFEKQKYQWQDENNNLITRAGLFVTKSKSWTEADWQDIPFRTFACLLEPDWRPPQQLGYRLFIYDPDVKNELLGNDRDLPPPYTTMPVSELFEMIQRFFEFVRQQKRTVKEIWVLGSVDGNPDGRYMEYTSRFLQTHIARWQHWPWSTEDLQKGGWYRVIEKPNEGGTNDEMDVKEEIDSEAEIKSESE